MATGVALVVEANNPSHRSEKRAPPLTFAGQEIQQVRRDGARLHIENAVVSDQASAHFGDNIYNIQSTPGTRRQKLESLLESLTFARMGARERNVADAISNTCDWLFEDEQFLAWENDEKVEEHHGFFWIKGKPGTGKSTLIKKAMIRAKIQSPGEPIFSYFFNGRSSDELEKTVVGVYRTLLHQMLVNSPDMHENFVNKFAAKEQGGEVDAWEEIELQNFFLECVCSRNTESLLIFVDAMDEGHDEDIERMVFFFEELTSCAVLNDIRLRFCLSSRHYPHIEVLHSTSIVLEHKPGHIDDIETYIHRSLPSGGKHMSDLRHLIIQRSEGIFLWVMLVIPVLMAIYRKGGSVMAMMKALEKVPRDLHDLFSSLLLCNSEDLDESMTLFRWVLYSFEPMTPDMLCAAVIHTHPSTLEDDDDDADAVTADRQSRYLLNISRGLVEFVEEFDDDFSIASSDDVDDWLNDPVLQTAQFIHQSVVDYLTGSYKPVPTLVESSDQRRTAFLFQAESSHANIARVCLEYLSKLSTSASLTPSTLKQWQLAPYAAKFWWRHILMSGNECDQSLRRLAVEFLISDECRKTWVQLYDPESPADLKTTQITRWSKQVLKHPSHFRNCPGPLSYAVILELPKIVEALMLSHAVADFWDETWGNALQVACCRGLWGIAELLLNYGADSSSQLGHRHRGTPLQLASLHGKENIVKLLLDRKVNVNVSTARLATALQEASKYGYEGIVKMLIDANAEVDFDLAKGDSALIRASAAGHEGVVEILLTAGASVDPEEFRNEQVVVKALLNRRLETVRALAAIRVAVDDFFFNSTLVEAFEERDQQKVAALLAAGPLTTGSAWDNALVRASAHGRDALVNLLLVPGIEADCRASGLYWACKNGHIKVAEMLLALGTNSNAAFHGASALTEAVSGNDVRMVKLLLDAGADPDGKVHARIPILMEAVIGIQEEIVKLLLAAGAKVFV